MITATADTNIYISALQFGGSPSYFLDLAREGAFRLAISNFLVEEMRGALSLKFGWSASMLGEALAKLARFTILVSPGEKLRVIEADPDGDRVLECAVASDSQFLITGDGHLLNLQQYEQVEIVRLSRFLQLLSPREGETARLT